MAIKSKPFSEKDSVKLKGTKEPAKTPERRDWWNANSKKDLVEQMLSNAAYLKQNQGYQLRQAVMFSKLYGNLPMYNAIGTSFTKMNTQGLNFPIDRPTMNVVQSCIDTLASRLTQSKPRPLFLTENGDHKMRSLAKQLNQFIMGEF